MKILRKIKSHANKIFAYLSLFSMLANTLAPLAAVVPSYVYAEDTGAPAEVSTSSEDEDKTAEGQDSVDEDKEKTTDGEIKTEDTTKETPIETSEGDILEDGVSDYRPVVEIEQEETIEVDEIPMPTEGVTTEPIPTIEISETEPSPVVEPEVPTVEEPAETPEVENSKDEDWNVDGEVAKTVEKVKLGVKYIFPLNEEVSVTFTKLPKLEEDRDYLKIERVEVDDLNLPDEFKTDEEYAYDITTDGMENGEFEYDLTLPKPEGVDVEVKYTEDGNTYESIDSNIQVNNSVVTIEGLEHFTIFVVVKPNQSGNGNTCEVASISGVCYDTIQEAVNAAESGDTIYVASGTYNETVNINKPNITLIGLGDPKPTIIGGFLINASFTMIEGFTVIGATESDNYVPSKPTGLYAKFQYDSENITNGGTLNITAKPGNNNLVLMWDTPKPIDLVTGHRIFATYPDGTTNLSYQGDNTNAWLKTHNGFGAHGNGKYIYQVIAVNANGTSELSDPFVIYYDNHIPTATFTSAPDNNSYISGNFEVAGTAQDNVALSGVFFDVRTQDGGTWVSGCKSGTTNLVYSSENKNATISCTINTSNLVNGTTYMLRIHASDYAGYGNVNSEAVRYFTMDTEKPSVPVLESPINGIYINDNTPLMQWADSSDGNSGVKGYYYRVFRNCTDINNSSTCSDVYPDLTGLWRTSPQYQAGSTPDGTYYWQVMAEDNAGNKSDWSDLEKVTIDTKEPTQPVITNTPNNAFTNINTITVNWEGGDDQGTNPSGIRGYIFRYVFTPANGDTVTDWSSGLVEVGNPKKRSGIFGHGEGKYVMYVKTVDNAGNESPESEPYTITYDKTSPTTTITTPGENTSWSKPIDIKGSSTDNNGIDSVSLEYAPYDSVAGTCGTYTAIITLTTLTTGTHNNWSYEDWTPAEGSYCIKAYATDNAGNVEHTAEIKNVTYDITIPEITLTTNPTDPDGSNDWFKTKPTITLTATDGFDIDRVEYQWGSDKGSWTTYTSPFKPDSEGKLVLYYRSIDKAGNESVGVKNIKVDTDKPSSVSNVKATYNESENSITLDWDVEDSDIKEVRVYKGKSSDFDTNSLNRISKQSADDEDYTDKGDLGISISRGNTYYYKLVAVDSAGNRSNTKKVSIKIPEEGAPVVTVEEGEVEGVGAGEEEEGQVAGEETGPEGEEVAKSAEGEEGSVLGEETAKASGEQSIFKSFWFWLVLVVLVALVIWLINKKSENSTKTKKKYM